MKSKKRPSTLPEEWEVVENTHEGIVTQEEFDTLQHLMTSRRIQKGKSGYDNIFAGLIKCADCGYAMHASSAHRRKRAELLDCMTYTCNNCGRYGNVMCSVHSIEARDLYEAVLADINRFAKMAVKNENAVRKISRKLADMSAGKQTGLVREERQLSKRQEKEQGIEIHYKFIGSLDELHISLTERYLEYEKKRICEECSGEYTAKTSVAKYCPDCREKVKARQMAEGYKRRQKRAAGT